jgi:erythromycin esterase-like protein
MIELLNYIEYVKNDFKGVRNLLTHKQNEDQQKEEINKIATAIVKEIDKTIKELEELKENIEIFEELMEEENKEAKYRKRIAKDKAVVERMATGKTKENYPGNTIRT